MLTLILTLSHSGSDALSHAPMRGVGYTLPAYPPHPARLRLATRSIPIRVLLYSRTPPRVTERLEEGLLPTPASPVWHVNAARLRPAPPVTPALTPVPKLGFRAKRCRRSTEPNKVPGHTRLAGPSLLTQHRGDFHHGIGRCRSIPAQLLALPFCQPHPPTQTQTHNPLPFVLNRESISCLFHLLTLPSAGLPLPPLGHATTPTPLGTAGLAKTVSRMSHDEYV